MKIFFVSVVALVLINICLVSSRDYDDDYDDDDEEGMGLPPPSNREDEFTWPPRPVKGQRPVNTRLVRCLVCKAALEEMLYKINRENPNKKIDIGGYSLDEAGDSTNKVRIPLTKSESYLTELMEGICDRMDDYAKARFKENNTFTILRMSSFDGGPNPNMGKVNFIDEGDMNKSLKHYCLEILEEHEETVLKLLMREKISEHIDIELCSLAGKYCDETLPEKDYVLEDHDEL